MTLNDALEEQAARAPNELALVDDRESVTWTGLQERVKRCAAFLKDIGLQPGERPNDGRGGAP